MAQWARCLQIKARGSQFRSRTLMQSQAWYEQMPHACHTSTVWQTASLVKVASFRFSEKPWLKKIQWTAVKKDTWCHLLDSRPMYAHTCTHTPTHITHTQIWKGNDNKNSAFSLHVSQVLEIAPGTIPCNLALFSSALQSFKRDAACCSSIWTSLEDWTTTKMSMHA